LRTLVLSPELFLAEGGIARIMRLYLKALCDEATPGDVVDCVVLNDPPATDPRLPRYSGPALHSCTGWGRSRLAFIRRTLRIGRTSDRAVCGHLHLLAVLWLARRFNSRLKYSLVAHGIEVWRPYSWLERRALLGAHRILCVSEYTRRQMLRFCPSLEPARLVLLPNALDPFFQIGSAAPSARPDDGPIILTVGRLSRADAYKGVDTLIEALPLVRRQYPTARLRVVGGGDDLPRLRALAAAQGMTESVIFTGVLSDEMLKAEYAGCDLFALPSRREGFGLVFLEAMAHGKPCLGARAGGIPEVLDDRVGALAEYGNISDIANAVIDLLRRPRDPDAIRKRVESFSFATFRQRLGAMLAISP
jgi:glycosyltransferase involved in cell wall biosynthesis